MYIKFENGIVAEIIPDIDPTFPDVPIGERYPVDFIEELLHIEDSTNVETGMKYDAETGSFGYPESTAVPNADEETVEDRVCFIIYKILFVIFHKIYY